jgi:hypothetical protein
LHDAILRSIVFFVGVTVTPFDVQHVNLIPLGRRRLKFTTIEAQECGLFLPFNSK